MAYVNPYASAMEYQPRTLWNQPERPRTDWSTFWGTPEEDEDNGDDNGDENGYNPEGKESQVVKGSGATLKSLWGDVMADIQENLVTPFKTGYGQEINQAVHPTKFSNQNLADLGPLTTVPNTQQFVGDWQNPNYTGGNTQVYNAQDLNAATTGLDTTTTQPSEVIQAYQPSYNQQQQATNAYSPSYATQADAYAAYPELSGNLGLLQDTSQISLADQLANNQAAIDQNALQRVTLAEELANNQVEIDQNARELGIFDTMQDVYSDPNLSEEDILW